MLSRGGATQDMPYFRAVAFVLAMAFFVMLVAPVQALARWRDWRLQHAIQKFFCRTMCRVIGVEVIPSGRLPGAAPRFVVANHVSWTDILAIASLYPLVFLAKSEVAKWPVLGFLARLQGTIFVDRGRRQAIPEVNAELAEVLRQGQDVVVFAEGTSSDGGSSQVQRVAFRDAERPCAREARKFGDGGASGLPIYRAKARTR